MFSENYLQQALLAGPIILLALTVHEYFHAWAALKFGDTTARDMGRLTLNPLAHLDLFGTICFVVSGFRFGWAKPVPVVLHNLKNPRVADLWVSAAGPLSNFGQAIIFGMLFRLLSNGFLTVPADYFHAVQLMLFYGVTINLGLAFFNLIPLFPLDGSHILRNLLPPRYDSTFDTIDQVAPFILLGMVFFGGVWLIIGPFVSFFTSLIAGN
ncbi:MAG: site-2 protease family protein [candidate division Zixibacteria bacterium]|nr:site-2 protease family protein [candidate division Zixibacteria bacterium]